jgi:hypothetical protein
MAMNVTALRYVLKMLSDAAHQGTRRPARK